MRGQRFAALLVGGLLLGALGAAFSRRPASPSSAGRRRCATPDTGEATLSGAKARAFITSRLLASTPGAATPVETDPRAPAYDPNRLARVANIDTIFRAEPRNDTWAAAVERALTTPLEAAVRSLVPEVQSVTLECRTTACAVGWKLPQAATPATVARLREVVRQVFPGSGRVVGSQRFAIWN